LQNIIARISADELAKVIILLEKTLAENRQVFLAKTVEARKLLAVWQTALCLACKNNTWVSSHIINSSDGPSISDSKWYDLLRNFFRKT